MPNINDYLEWRGDLSFEQSPMNEIDKMILSRFSYLPFHEIKMKKEEKIEDVMKKFLDYKIGQFNIAGDKPLCENLYKSNRFKDLIVTDFYMNNNLEMQEQFSAITIHLPDGTLYISYCGTDNTLVGWKEDFNMSFMMHVPCQLEGVKYLTDIANKYEGNIYLSGHSKGGNIAVYSAIYADKKIKDRIINVTNHEGPGFDNSIISTKKYKEIIDRIHTYIPQESVIGRLLEHEEKYKVIKSTEKGIMQHDIYSWQVLGTDIIEIGELTNGSNLVNKTIRNYLKDTTVEQRKAFVDIVYQIMTATNATTMRELSLDKVKTMTTMIKSYRNLNEEDKKMVKEVIVIIGKAVRKTLEENQKREKKPRNIGKNRLELIEE